MEFIDGQTLQQKIDHQGQLELKEILRIGRQVAAGLAAAHEQGLMSDRKIRTDRRILSIDKFWFIEDL